MTRRVPQKAVSLPIEQIHPGRNVRIDLTNIDSLGESIDRIGLLQPLIVVPVSGDPKDGVEVIAGHRRLAACIQIDYSPVECHMRARGTEEWRLLAQVAENLEREPMSMLEKALAFRDLADGGMTSTAIGEAFGLTGGRVATMMELLKYPEVMQEHVHKGTIGLHDCLAVPLEIAKEADGRTLSARCRSGGRTLRNWARAQVQLAEAKGRKIARSASRDSMIIAIDGALGEEVRIAAADAKEGIGVWVGKACRTRLAEQAARRGSRI